MKYVYKQICINTFVLVGYSNKRLLIFREYLLNSNKLFTFASNTKTHLAKYEFFNKTIMEFFNTYFLDIIKNKYADFNGRARRKEYWMYTLVYILSYLAIAIVGVILGQIASFLGSIIFMVLSLLSLAVLVPSLAVSVRRLHDTNKSGWFLLLAFIPLANFYLIYLLIIEGDRGDNQYGADPKAGER